MTFTLDRILVEGSNVLYAGERGPPPSSLPYFLLVTEASTPATLSLPESWASKGASAYVFSTAPIESGLSQLATALGLGGGTDSTRSVAWRDADSGRLVVIPMVAEPSGGEGRVDGGRDRVNVPFGNVSLYLPNRTAVTVSESAMDLMRTTGEVMQLTRQGVGSPQKLGEKDAVRIGFGPSDVGRLSFSLSGDASRFYTFFRDDPLADDDPTAGELRYFVEAEGAARQLVYALLPTAARNAVRLDFAVTLDPLAPNDGTRTAFRLLRVPDGVTATYAATVAGAAVGLKPIVADGVGAAGFYLARRPPTEDEKGEKDCVYLAPLGPFAIEGVPGGRANLMCGLSGLEYLVVSDGDIVEFVPSQPARVPPGPTALGSADTPAPPPLDPTYTTSWARFRPRSSSSYFAQPTASVNYAGGVIPQGTGGGAMKMPSAVASLVRPLPAAAATEPFPFVPYGKATVTGSDNAAADLLRLVEHKALSAIRAEALRTTARTTGALGDVVGPPDPVFADASGKPLEGGRASTPHGHVVVLNSTKTPPAAAAGTWNRVLLGRTDGPSGAQYLSFEPIEKTGVVDAALASTLVRDQVFLVLNNWGPRFPMKPNLHVAGYDVSISPTATDPAATVLVVKYATGHSLEELVEMRDLWADPSSFLSSGVGPAQDALRDAITVAKAAEGKPDDPFVHFRKVVLSQPWWTGLLSFNAPINGRDMPSDLQMLFAGIDGQLTAHHFGIEVNRVAPSDAGPEIAESSVFGVIHYPSSGAKVAALRGLAPVAVADPAPSNFSFAVRELEVAIANSTVTDFHARVGVTVNTLFGRDVELTPPNRDGHPNELTIGGTYQRHGTVGTVTFAAANLGALEFVCDDTSVRVLEAFAVKDASLVPVTADGPATDAGNDLKKLSARFTFGGELSFRADPFPGVTGLDLYSYGQDGKGLRLSGLSLLITFELDDKGQRVGVPVIVADLGSVLVADNDKGRRVGSLVDRLPLTVRGFLQDEKGLDPSKIGGLPLNVVQLMGDPQSDKPATPAYTAPRPTYAVQYKMPLGSLGALSDVHAGIEAAVVIAWGPSSYTPENDGAAVFVQLPQLSAGAFGFNLEGLLKTTFGDANLLHISPKVGEQTEPGYVVLFNNVALSVLGIKLPPQVITDFILFAGKDDAGRVSLGWNLAATKVKSST